MAATSIEGKILEALKARFETVTLPTGVSVVWPNRNFDPNIAHPYVRCTFMPNTPITHDIGGSLEPERVGLFQASVFWPAGAGATKPIDLAATIRAAFAYGSVFTSGGVEVRIVEEPIIGGLIQESAWCQVPVTVPWHCYP